MRNLLLIVILALAGCSQANTTPADPRGLSPDVAKNGKYALALTEQLNLRHPIDEQDLAMAMARTQAAVTTPMDREAYESLQLFREFTSISSTDEAIRVRVNCMAAALAAFKSRDPGKYFPPNYQKCKSAFADLHGKQQS